MRNQTPIIIDWVTRSITIAQDSEYRLAIRATIGRNIVEGTLPMAITITATQFFTVSVSAVDARGNPAPLDGLPSWASSDAALLTVDPNPDGTARVAAVGALGNAQVTVSADADLGEGVRTLTGLLDVTVVAGEAVALTVATSIPQEQ